MIKGFISIDMMNPANFRKIKGNIYQFVGIGNGKGSSCWKNLDDDGDIIELNKNGYEV